jgi:DNA-binding transcriptional regulator YiaG
MRWRNKNGRTNNTLKNEHPMTELAPHIIPDKIRNARNALGLTQAELAPLLGYGDVARVSELERGARQPGGAVLRLLHAYLDGYRPPDWPRHDSNAVRAPLAAALRLTDDTILKRIIEAALDYHGTPQGAFEEEGGAEAMRGIADTLRNAADALDSIAERMEERE